MKNDINGVRTAQELERKYDLGKLVEVTYKNNDTLVHVNNELKEFVAATTESIENLQEQIDGEVTTWFYNGVPTLNNEPAVNWVTDEDKNNHLGDLYYDQSTGYAYRFVVNNNVYSWMQISDSAVAEALALAQAAQDTADSKRRVFVATPTPPYDIGDLWITSSKELYRCITATTPTGTYNPDHWIVATKYTDDTAANNALSIANSITTEVHRDYATSADLYKTADSINSVVKSIETTGYYTYSLTEDATYQADKFYFNSLHELLVEGDDYNIGDTIMPNSVYERTWTETLRNEMISAINQTPEQISINANKLNLAGKTFNLTTDNMAITSTNFSVDNSGNMACSNATVNGVINSNSGKIGNYNIDDEGLYSDFYAPYNYTSSDVQRLQDILNGVITPTPEDIQKYDIYGEGTLDIKDLLAVNLFVYYGVSTTVPLRIAIKSGKTSTRNCYEISVGNTTHLKMGIGGITTHSVSTESLDAGNIDCGTISITPIANTPTYEHVDFNKTFTSPPVVTATAESSVIGSTVRGVSVANVTTTGCDIYIYRTNNTSTNINWIAIA